ncbi:hypothetical protein ECANGB1_384 [Enterospora canceri]|uniref:Uncharacterized protein n=1 Tax=Enterospora canceri TaxID=1081671 RepID=A0A1Y1S8U3_9MICR|nr:hypothetical protein ECANGB1_384 [Enterospora canceri]
MKLSRESNADAKLFIALLSGTVAILWKRDKKWLKYLPYAVVLLTDLIGVLYIKIKKREYRNLFLQYRYNPCDLLFLITFVIEVPAIVVFYALIQAWPLLAAHLVAVLLLYVHIYQGRKAQRTKIRNNVRMHFEYGILKEDIPHSPLFKGSFVKIHKRQGDMLVVKDYDNNSYEIEVTLVTNITKVNLY